MRVRFRVEVRGWRMVAGTRDTTSIPTRALRANMTHDTRNPYP